LFQILLLFVIWFSESLNIHFRVALVSYWGFWVRCYGFAFDFVGDFAETHNGGCAKRAHDVHSASLGGGDCWGFGWVGMEAQMGQDFGQGIQGRFASFTDHHIVVYVFPFDSELERVEVSAAQLHFLDHR
jgi:hypothetical protein